MKNEKNNGKSDNDWIESGNSPPKKKSSLVEKKQERSGKFLEILIGVESVAKMLGISENTVYSWVHQRKFPFYKIGRLVKFKYKEVLRWIAKQKVTVYET